MPLNMIPEYGRMYGKKGQPPFYRVTEGANGGQARWAGVPFEIESSSDEFGRRGDVYEYPLGEDVGYKDLGRKAKRFKVEGYLIGSNQWQLAEQMRDRAETPEPQTLEHPLWGSISVACVTLTMSADYRRDKRRTKLSFEFVEALPPTGALATGRTIEEVWSAAADAARQAEEANAAAEMTLDDTGMSEEMQREMAGLLTGAGVQSQFVGGGGTSRGAGVTFSWGDEQTLDAIDANTALSAAAQIDVSGVLPMSPMAATLATPRARAGERTVAQQRVTFASLIWPIDYGSSVLREFHDDALEHLREFNRFVVNRQEATPTAQALIMTIRLIILRDFAVAAARKNYETIKDALDDLDFIVASYDDEEAIATQNCDDVLVNLIYRARAAATSAILARSIRLPGIVEFSVDGVWPSVVCAWKVYADSRRHETLERYNPSQMPMFMGRDIVAPAR